MSTPGADVLIVGGGPAGLSAALTLVRQRHSVLLFDMAKSRALASARLHGTPGTDRKRPSDVLEQIRSEIASYTGFSHQAAQIVNIKHAADNGFDAEDDQGNIYHGLKVILCNGVKDTFPDIPGYPEAWGKGIFHNPFAQGYQQDVSTSHSGVLAVDWIAMPKYTLHLAHLLSQLTSTVTIYTHGNTQLASEIELRLVESTLNRTASTVKVDNRTIARLALESPTQSSTMQIHFTDNTCTTEAFLGHAAMTSLNGPFAGQLGIDVSPTGAEYVVSGPANQTNIEGVYAAGDAMTMLKVWPSAIASGAVTAAGVAIALQEERWGLPSIFA